MEAKLKKGGSIFDSLRLPGEPDELWTSAKEETMKSFGKNNLILGNHFLYQSKKLKEPESYNF